MVLNYANFMIVNELDHVLVEFYAPWCGHCQALAPEFEKAAKALAAKESDVFLGKVDATVEEELAKEYHIDGYPTLKWFTKGLAKEYEGPHDANGILRWIEKKTGDPAEEVKTVEDLESKREENKAIVVGFFKDLKSGPAMTFLDAARDVDDTLFYMSREDKVMNNYESLAGDVIVLKTFDEKLARLEAPLTKENLIKFVKATIIPLVTEFSEENADKVFDSDIKAHLILMSDKKDKGHNGRISELTQVAKKYREVMHAVHLDVGFEDNVNLLEFFGIMPEQCPTYIIFEVESGSKYLSHDNEITATKMGAFAKEYVDGKLRKTLKSEPLPDDWDAKPVKVLVTLNFKEIAMDKGKDAFIMFYAPWCDLCKKVAPIWDELGEKYKDRKDIVIAKMDGTANELEEIEVDAFPTFHIVKKETNEIDEYYDKKDLATFSKFLETGEQDEDYVDPNDDYQDEDYPDEEEKDYDDYPDEDYPDEDEDDEDYPDEENDKKEAKRPGDEL